MATVLKTLGTADSVTCGLPSSENPLVNGTWNTLYVCPAGKKTTISVFGILNTGTAVVNVSAAVIQDYDEGLPVTRNGQHRIAPNTPIGAKERYTISEGWTLAAGDKLVIMASAVTDISFWAHGREDDV